MARRQKRPPVTREVTLECVQRTCPECGESMWIDYENTHTVSRLGEVVRLRLKVRRCQNASCGRYHQAYRPEAEGGWALPQHEFGLDVIAQIGALRYQEHRTVGEIHNWLRGHEMVISARSVSNLLDRYDELVALRLQDHARLQHVLAEQERVILALDGLQPTVGHEVLWVLRDCISGEVLLARALLSSTGPDIATLITEVQTQLPVPITGVISDGQQSLQKAVAQALPEVPHGLCHYHYLREAGREIYAADRHAKKELKKQVRGVRPLERAAEKRDDELGGLIQGYCQAVRSALTDAGRAPLDAAGLRLHGRLTAISQSLARVEKKGRCPRNSTVCKR
jgi:hypothetical protein